ncbi:hypothetical protein D7X96_10465 [Corallococcus interemptor]|uniref:OsmC family peroxiredoxin n=1 Tax=Corallococcus interemptor TaxID=2316720 RepID=A0A3A8QWK7_9BACT|nr:OsmC family protein [Corallococcus interemptor]RKH70805.1 hypothetical protein D7X96_10465 [Corallococcus interemptor]
MAQPMYTGQVRTVGESMARSTTEAQAFKIFMDEPVELGGQNGAPSPLDFILAAHAGYQSLTATIHVKGDVTQEQLAHLLREVETRCPVSDNLAHATPIHLSMVPAV